MRYQPAYVYSGACKPDLTLRRQEKGWSLHMPSFNAGQVGFIGWLRFALIMIGFLLAIIGVAHYVTAKDVLTWEQRSVTITRADVVRMKYEGGAPVFTAQIEYQYLEGDKIVTGDRLSLHPVRSTSPGLVKRHVAAYSVGRTVLAHVNPDRPGKSYLSAQPTTYLYSLILPGLILMALSFMIGYARYLQAVREQRKDWRFGEFKGPVNSVA